MTRVEAAIPLPAVVAANGPLPEDRQRRLLIDVARALAALHADNRVHGGLSPGGVGIAADSAVLLPMGWSTFAESAGYLSPEAAAGRPIGPAADVYALGAVLVYAATGAGPYGEGTPTELLSRVLGSEPDLSGVAPSLRELAAGCLRKDPEQRPMAAQIAGWLTAEDQATPRLSLSKVEPDPPSARKSPRRRVAMVVGALMSVVTVTAAVVLFGFDSDAEQSDDSSTDTAAATTSPSAPAPVIEARGSITDIAMAPDGRRLYVVVGNSIRVLDTATRSFLPSISGVDNPFRLDVSPDGATVYATGNGSVATIDTRSNKVTATVPLGARSQLVREIVAAANGRDIHSLYVDGPFDNESLWYAVLDPRTGAVSARTRIPAWQSECLPRLHLSPDQRRAYVWCLSAELPITVLDAGTGAMLAEIPLGWQISNATTSADGARLYATGYGANKMAIIDTTSNTVSDTKTPGGLGLMPAAMPARDGRHIFLTSCREDVPCVRIFDPVTSRFLDIEGPKLEDFHGDFMALSLDGRSLFLAETVGGRMVVLDVGRYA